MNKLTSTTWTGTANLIKPLSALVSLAIVLSGCGDGASIPNAPTPTPTLTSTPTPAPTETYTLSGVVFELTEAGQVPIEGVELYCDSCGSPVGHTFVYTDADGFYSLDWTSNGVHHLLVEKAGFEIFDPTGSLTHGEEMIVATVRGDTRFDIRLARR
jgi:hypothetical protein